MKQYARITHVMLKRGFSGVICKMIYLHLETSYNKYQTYVGNQIAFLLNKR